MEFADYGIYTDDADHHIDLRNPHFRQESYQHMQHHHVPTQDFYAHAQFNPHYAHHLASLAVDVKPRLTKEQHDILESHYQQQSKPNTQTKKGFAEALGVSLDKVNNWFQNRRAKSKQDAKKAAGQYVTSGQNGQQGQQNQTSQSGHASHASSGSVPQLNISTEDLSAQFLSSEYLDSPHNDSAISVDPMALSNGLGITSEMSSPQQPPTTMSPQELMTRAVQSSPANLKVEHNDDIENHRRTLTQEQFDSFANGGDYIAGKNTSSTLHDSPKQLQGNDMINDFLGDFAFTNSGHDDLDSNDMQTDFSSEPFGSGSSFFTEHQANTPDHVPRNLSTQSSISDWSEHSTPSLSITPVVNQADSGYAASETEISPRGKIGSTSSTQWQPGQSVPVDFTAMDREFQEAAARAESQSSSSGHTRRNSLVPFADQQMAFANEQSFTQSEAPAALTQGMNNMGLNSTESTSQPTSRTGSSSGGIAARRQRPRPQPLATSSLRSASYCGTLPTAPGMHTSTNMTSTPAPPTLRRIKSSNVMNGIASGRIQKSISGAQRSPLNFTFAEAMNSPKFARRVSSYSPANGGLPLASASLAPPTPLSPTELSHRLELQRQTSQMLGAHSMSRQPSINELHEESQHQMLSAGQSNTFSSPPSTPNYAAHLVRSRLASGMMSESTPPQSAPATQQCFPSNLYASAPQMQTTMSQGPMMSSQQQTYVPIMSNEYPTMHNVVMPSQQMQAGQYLQMLQAQQQMEGMSHMMPTSQPMTMGFNAMQFGHGLGAQQITPPNMQFPFVPSNNNNVLLSQGHQIHHGQSKSVPAADFFVHEYSPPQDAKRNMTPRKSADTGPKNYTFANHGPEHFEKTKQKDLSQSPGSSSGQSSGGV
ncbi:hypothetical protein CAC42_7719 [Sphaceloma murrayae]|uniref:Homeobox domain-containing protein n=1 Tax=Sphaceloma murrayae TaxID=2082308 RepID=A0A2K1QXH4_9PEZI|nr:hypothetical protein CAC42_7719 [Sphaceloma murrayae]